jgi:predicted acylesterase/phospholipase RssA
MKKIGLVLSGGGARGIAHLGVLKAWLSKKSLLITFQGVVQVLLLG